MREECKQAEYPAGAYPGRCPTATSGRGFPPRSPGEARGLFVKARRFRVPSCSHQIEAAGVEDVPSAELELLSELAPWPPWLA
jgi:hypothetical protein